MLTERQEIESALHDFILEQTGAEKVACDTDLFASGLMDSFMVVSIAAFSEERFGRELPLLELDPANFRSINTLAELVTRCGAREANT